MISLPQLGCRVQVRRAGGRLLLRKGALLRTVDGLQRSGCKLSFGGSPGEVTWFTGPPLTCQSSLAPTIHLIGAVVVLPLQAASQLVSAKIRRVESLCSSLPGSHQSSVQPNLAAELGTGTCLLVG